MFCWHRSSFACLRQYISERINKYSLSYLGLVMKVRVQRKIYFIIILGYFCEYVSAYNRYACSGLLILCYFGFLYLFCFIPCHYLSLVYRSKWNVNFHCWQHFNFVVHCISFYANFEIFWWMTCYSSAYVTQIGKLHRTHGLLKSWLMLSTKVSQKICLS